MANALYDSGKERLLGHSTESINLVSDTIKVILIDSADYTASLSTHTHLDDVAAAARVATATLASKTTTGGVFDAGDVTFTSVTGDQSEALVIYKDTGVETTSPLIAYIDTVTSGLPVTPSGGNIVVTWNASGIFTL
jgi:hypothetical protein